MAKEKFYFQHDYDPTGDLKIGALLSSYGAFGYGLYWRLVEILHSEESHKIPMKDYVFLSLSNQMCIKNEHMFNTCSTHVQHNLTPVEQIRVFVEHCINKFELFNSDGDFFWSERVFKNINIRNELKSKKSEAGKASAKSRSLKNNSTGVQHLLTHVEQNLTHVEQNPTNKRKVKERKEKKIKIEEENTDSEILFYRKFKHLKLSFDEFDKLLQMGFTQQEIDKNLDSIENYKKNTNYVSLYLTVKNWIIKDREMKPKDKIEGIKSSIYNGSINGTLKFQDHPIEE